MPFSATVLPVMIASPGDVHQYRKEVRDVLHQWNYIHTDVLRVALMPVGWDTHSSPELGSTAQDLINERVLEECDLLVGIFWTRLGTPTGRAASGTVEEIQRHVDAGKPAMLYFSERPAEDGTVDREQLRALREFQSWCESRGLVERFFDESDLRDKLRAHLQIALYKNPYLKALTAVKAPESTTTTSSQPKDEFFAVAKSLSPEARSILTEAAKDQSGTIISVAYLEGRVIQAGRKQMAPPGDARVSARWLYGLEQLETLGLVELVSTTGKQDKVYEIRERGYLVAEALGDVPH